MSIIRFGLDLAKNSIAIYGVNEHEKMVVRKTLKREKLLEFFANVPPALLAMEAGSGAHHWARELRALGHDARIIDPRFVAPSRQQGHTGKNDFNDAAAVCEAGGRPQMRFIPMKSKQQQAVLLVHRQRQACVTEHTRLINRLRGFLAEFGIVAPQGAHRFKARWPVIRQHHDADLPSLAWEVPEELYAEVGRLHQKILAFDRQLNAIVRSDPSAMMLASINGIGPITASAVVADLIDTLVGRTAITFRTLELWSNRKARVTTRPDDDARAARRERGQAPVPAIAVVTQTLQLDWESSFFTEAVARPIVVTSAAFHGMAKSGRAVSTTQSRGAASAVGARSSSTTRVRSSIVVGSAQCRSSRTTRSSSACMRRRSTAPTVIAVGLPPSSGGSCSASAGCLRTWTSTRDGSKAAGPCTPLGSC